MFGIVLTPFYKAILIIAAVIAVFGIGYYKGHRNTQDKFDAYKAEVAAKAAEQSAKTEVINQNNNKIAKEVSNGYKNSLTAVRQHYNRMQLNGVSTVSTVSNATTGTNAAPTYDVLAEQCAETTLQIVTLQDYIKSIKANY